MDWPSLGREDLELATSDEVCEMFPTVPEDDDFLVLPTAWECCFESCDELLGEGTFGRISKVLDSLTGQHFAVKVVNRGAMPESQQLENEVHALQCCSRKDCRNIVRYFDLAEESNHVFIRMELCSNGTVLQYALGQPGSRVMEGLGVRWAQQLFVGLGDMHTLGIMHRDIKPENLLLADDASLRISDFGWAAKFDEQAVCLAGTFHYMAPEVLRLKDPHTEAVDVWSAGVTFYELLTGTTLLAVDEDTGFSVENWTKGLGIKIERFLKEISMRCPIAKDQRPVHLSPDCWTLLQAVVQPDVNLRATVPYSLEFMWFAAPGTARRSLPCQPICPVTCAPARAASYSPSSMLCHPWADMRFSGDSDEAGTGVSFDLALDAQVSTQASLDGDLSDDDSYFEMDDSARISPTVAAHCDKPTLASRAASPGLSDLASVTASLADACNLPAAPLARRPTPLWCDEPILDAPVAASPTVELATSSSLSSQTQYGSPSCEVRHTAAPSCSQEGVQQPSTVLGPTMTVELVNDTLSVVATESDGANFPADRKTPNVRGLVRQFSNRCSQRLEVPVSTPAPRRVHRALRGTETLEEALSRVRKENGPCTDNPATPTKSEGKRDRPGSFVFPPTNCPASPALSDVSTAASTSGNQRGTAEDTRPTSDSNPLARGTANSTSYHLQASTSVCEEDLIRQVLKERDLIRSPTSTNILTPDLCIRSPTSAGTKPSSPVTHGQSQCTPTERDWAWLPSSHVPPKLRTQSLSSRSCLFRSQRTKVTQAHCATQPTHNALQPAAASALPKSKDVQDTAAQRMVVPTSVSLQHLDEARDSGRQRTGDGTVPSAGTSRGFTKCTGRRTSEHKAPPCASSSSRTGPRTKPNTSGGLLSGIRAPGRLTRGVQCRASTSAPPADSA
uniref:Protein kinase domain-containing protein n=1 Tax=Noctiluca scintillans TaxID=2966 RepID=A0A7S1A921_NOCSC|mmetsp:Transcript_36789/g.97959  ORF Transcript_36789/g.97959 Transcript_36789/m.97959 type:complete len:904 (+) Transcript_36789:70-2781(+)